MLKSVSALIFIVGVSACVGNQASHPVSAAAAVKTVSAPAPVVLRSGIDLQYVDSAVRPQDDVYQHLNGQWLRDYQLPADKGAVGSFTAIQDRTEEQLRSIVDGLDQT